METIKKNLLLILFLIITSYVMTNSSNSHTSKGLKVSKIIDNCKSIQEWIRKKGHSVQGYIYGEIVQHKKQKYSSIRKHNHQSKIKSYNTVYYSK